MLRAVGGAATDIVDSQSRVDLVVSYVGLPGGISGRRLADTARQEFYLKVLFITGWITGFREPRTGRSSVWRGETHLGDGLPHSDRGGAGRNAGGGTPTHYLLGTPRGRLSQL